MLDWNFCGPCSKGGDEPRRKTRRVFTREFVNLRGVYPPLKDADKINFVEEIQRSESDYKQLGEKYGKFFKKGN